MLTDRDKVLLAFKEYTSCYDVEDEKVRLKIEHTYRVSELCERIADSLGMSPEDKDLAWLLGILHDVGRFEQLRRFGTFLDRESIDHAALGSAILFEQGRIRAYMEDSSGDKLFRTAVESHSLYRLPENLDKRTKCFCQILRDADKIDILKVNIDFPYEEVYNVTTQELQNTQVSSQVMEAFMEEHAVKHSLKKSTVDYIIGHISLIYELVYPESRRIVQEQGYLDKMLDFTTQNETAKRQFSQIKRKMTEYLGLQRS